MRHGEPIAPSPWVELLKVEDRWLWEGLSSPLEYGDCNCEAGCECDRSEG